MNHWNIVFTITFMLGLWMVDVSVTTMNLGVLTNGFLFLAPEISYHIGILVSIISFFLNLCVIDYNKRSIRFSKP